MRKNLSSFLLTPALLLALTLSPRPASAWNATGHEVVALIAWDQLSSPVKAKITALLKSHPDYATALTRETTPAGDQRDTEAFAVAATWPDLIRSPSFGKSHLLEHSIWHYADSPYAVGNVTPTEEPPDFKWSKGGRTHQRHPGPQKSHRRPPGPHPPTHRKIHRPLLARTPRRRYPPTPPRRQPLLPRPPHRRQRR